MKEQLNILRMKTDVADLKGSVKEILRIAEQGDGGYVCLSNVHMCMEVYDCEVFAKVVNNANLVLADGKPISLVQRLAGYKGAKQIRGQTLVESICEIAGAKELNIGLYGGKSDAIVGKVKSELEKRYPNINICFTFSPPFRPLSVDEERHVIEQLNEAKVNILFVGIGCPKQEIWMANNAASLSCVMLGVGACFDFISGEKKHAPIILQKVGLEWAFRLFSEPERLWKRYLFNNPRFIYHVTKQMLKGLKVL